MTRCAALGPGRGPVSSGAPHRWLAVCVSRWGQSAGAATGGDRKRVQLLVACGVRGDPGRCSPLPEARGKVRRRGERRLQDLYRRGLKGWQLQLIITDGCAGLATALQTVYPRVAHQRAVVVHTLRNLLGAVRVDEATPPSRRTPRPSIRPVRGPTRRATPSSDPSYVDVRPATG